MFDDTSQWTVDTLHEYNEAIRKVESEFQAERDRRYTEEAIEREKALRIKETADLAALSLARESQTYKEQQNDALRDKNLAESGVYATNSSVAAAIDATNANFTQRIGLLENKLEIALKPLSDFVSAQKGQSRGAQLTMGNMYQIIGAAGPVVFVIYKMLGH